MYQYIQFIIYIYFRKDIKWGKVPCNLRELLNKYLRWSRVKVTAPAPAPAKYPGSGRLRLRYPGPTVQQVQNPQFYLSALLLFAGSGSGTIIPGPDAGESSGVLVFVFLIMYYFVVMIRCTYINYILSYFFFSSRRRR